MFSTPVERDSVKFAEAVDHPGDRFLRLKLGNVELPNITFTEYQPGIRKNVLIHVLFDNSRDDPQGSDLAILRYLPGAYVPLHAHVGHEMVLVLQGEYVENDVLYRPGSLIVRAPGTTHEMRSDAGCTILAMRDIPVSQLT